MAKKIDINGLDHFKEKENAMIASEYSSSKTYAVGDYCYHAGVLQCCTTPITTAENWTAGHWTAAKLADDCSSLKTAVTQIDTVLDASVENVSKNLIDNRAVIGKTPAQAFQFESYVTYIPLIWGDNLSAGNFKGYFVLNDGTTDQTNLNAIVIELCDESKTAITGSITQGNFNSQTFTVPVTAKYLKLTMYNWTNYSIVKLGLCQTEYENYSEEYVSERLNTIEADIVEEKTAFDDITKLQYNGSYFDFSSYEGKKLFGSNSLFSGSGTTFDIDISDLHLYGKSVSTFLWIEDETGFASSNITEVQLDANGVQIYPTNGYHYVGHPMAILAEAKTIRLYASANAYNAWSAKNLLHAQLYGSGTTQVDFETVHVVDIISTWKGKKLVTYGDSITQLGSWQPYLADKFGFVVTNAGLGGSCVADGNTQQVASFTDTTRIAALPSDAAVVTIMGGTNDFNGTNSGDGTPIGELPTDDDYDTTEFIGALCKTVQLIQTQCPYALIVIMSNVGGRGTSGQAGTYPIHNSLGLTTSDYAKAAENVANFMCVPFVDVHGCGINPFNRTRYITDTVHPNAEGAKLIARKVIDYFANNYPLD